MHKYNLPSVLIGVKLQLKGHHDDAGHRTCAGSVYLEVAGGTFKNPLSYVAIVGLVISAGTLLYAGRPVFEKISAFEDINPG